MSRGMRASKPATDPEVPELDKLDALLAFNTTERSKKRAVLAARLARMKTAAFLREIVDAEVDRRLSGASASQDQRSAAAG